MRFIQLRNLGFILLSAWVMLTDAAAQEQRFRCERDEFARKFGRAWDSREDHFFWEDLDQDEASANLDRYLDRLRNIVETGSDCSDAAIHELVDQARRQLSTFELERGKPVVSSTPDARTRSHRHDR